MTTGTDKAVWEGPKQFRSFLIPIDKLEPFPDNPRRGDVEAVAKSLRRFGQLRTIVVDPEIGAEGFRRIVAGHHVTLAAESLGWTHVAAVDNDFGSEDEARAYLLGDNRTSELGTIDEEALASQIKALRAASVTLEGTGYTERDASDLDRKLKAIRDAAIAFAINPDLDDAPDPPYVAQSQPGEVYELGPHRLICGDSRDPATYEKLLEGAQASMVWTDPPYGVSYEGGTADKLTIQNDDEEGLVPLLQAAFRAATGALIDGAPFYIAAPSGRRGVDFQTAIADAGWRHHQTLVWVKDVLVLGHSDYHFRHEDVHYGWTAGGGRAGRGSHEGSRWYGDHAETTVFEIPRPRRSSEHPTMKPIELVAHGIRNSSPGEGGSVLDPFAGSGSTMIAADLLDRRAYLVELDPRYCDVIRARWEAFSVLPDDQRLLPSSTQRMMLTPTAQQAVALNRYVEILEVELGTSGVTATLVAAAERLARDLNQGA